MEQTMLNPQFQIGERVTTLTGETGIVYAILYSEKPNGEVWKEPGFTYWIHFDTPRQLNDTAHESELQQPDDFLP